MRITWKSMGRGCRGVVVDYCLLEGRRWGRMVVIARYVRKRDVVGRCCL